MKKNILLTITLLLTIFCYSQEETYTIGKTEYYYNKHYTTTGKPVIKRSEINKRDFLKSKGYSETPKGYEIDHIIPLSEGGTDDPNNMQLLTIKEHRLKTAKERANRNSSNYSSSYTSTYNNENITNATYSRTDDNGRILYKGSEGGEYYINRGGNRVYIKREDAMPTYNNNTSNSTYSTAPTNNSSREIYTGSRGGQYYINSNGNKTYIKSK